MANVMGVDTSQQSVPLSGIIAAGNDDPFDDEHEVIHYSGSLMTSMNIMGAMESSPKALLYKVGVRNAAGNIARPVDLYRVDTSMPTTLEVQKSCEEMGRRNPAMPATWGRMDLFGVVQRLAMGCAYYSVYGALTTVNLRGGGQVNIAAVAAMTSSIAADNSAVFVSTKLVSNSRPNVLAAIINAVSGEGGTVYTDLLGVALNGAVLVPNAEDAGLAQGCHDALRILESLFQACEMGAFFALAVTEGTHRILSVHGHTDEGAYCRSVFRRHEASVPFGAIPVDLPEGNSMPSPGRSVSGFRGTYHGIALATAGAVALSDPMVEYNGRMYPTVLVSDNGAIDEPHENNDGNAADSADMTTRWAEAAPRWAMNFARALELIFNVSGGIHEVIRHLTVQANSLAGTDERHMRFKSAVAFFWIEPTGSCPVGNNTFPAFVNNHGPLAVGREARRIPAIDGVSVLSDRSDHSRITAQIDLRYLRRHGMFLHLSQHVRDGMGHIILATGVVNDLMNVGGAGPLGGRILAANPLSTYMWGRGDCAVIAGGEFISLSGSNIVTFVRTQLNAQGQLRNTHCPNEQEIVEGETTLTVSRLIGSTPAPPLEPPNRNIRRARSLATIALSMAEDSMRIGTVVNQQLMRPSLIDPGPVPALASRTMAHVWDGDDVQDNGAVNGANAIIPMADIGPRNGPAAPGGTANGPMAPVRTVNRSDRGPRAPQAGRIGGGGRAAGGGGGGGNIAQGGPPGPFPPPGVPRVGDGGDQDYDDGDRGVHEQVPARPNDRIDHGRADGGGN